MSIFTSMDGLRWDLRAVTTCIVQPAPEHARAPPGMLQVLSPFLQVLVLERI